MNNEDFTPQEKQFILHAVKMFFQNGVRGAGSDPVAAVENTVIVARSIERKLMAEEVKKLPEGG